MTDQQEDNKNKFEVFKRKTMEHVGTFEGMITRNTDGVWLTQKKFGTFEKGAFYTVHDDGNVTTFLWATIVDRLFLKVVQKNNLITFYLELTLIYFFI